VLLEVLLLVSLVGIAFIIDLAERGKGVIRVVKVPDIGDKVWVKAPDTVRLAGTVVEVKERPQTSHKEVVIETDDGRYFHFASENRTSLAGDNYEFFGGTLGTARYIALRSLPTMGYLLIAYAVAVVVGFLLYVLFKFLTMGGGH
jgi:hypothetical protein